MNLDRDFRELDCVVVYLPSGEKHRQWVKPTACNRKRLQARTLQQPAGAGRAWESR